MYIKSIIIEGFKSYSDRTIVGPFHPGHNVVVGRNGSGKSNFFSAIEFVLSPEFSNLSSEKARIALLHRGVGPQPINAFVEIIFDNSDGRFPLESEEVTIRRVIGSKKDQFFINGKLASSKSEIQGDLETAGLSCSNPYYIVKQGQINHIASCTASRRLKVIKEVAGAGVYEEKMVKAEQQLVITNNMIDEIEENLKNIRNKLEQLTEENEALEEYRKADRQKRALEFTILEADIEDNTKKQREVEITLQSDSVQAVTMMSSLKKAEEDLMDKRNKLEKLKTEKADLDVEHVSLQKTYDSILSRKEKMILEKKEEVSWNGHPEYKNREDYAHCY